MTDLKHDQSPLNEGDDATIIVVRENKARNTTTGISHTSIARVLVTPNSVTWMSDLDLPQEATHVLEMCPGITYPGSGIFYLCYRCPVPDRCFHQHEEIPR